jgi:hypothetical protein
MNTLCQHAISSLWQEPIGHGEDACMSQASILELPPISDDIRLFTDLGLFQNEILIGLRQPLPIHHLCATRVSCIGLVLVPPTFKVGVAEE